MGRGYWNSASKRAWAATWEQVFGSLTTAAVVTTATAVLYYRFGKPEAMTEWLAGLAFVVVSNVAAFGLIFLGRLLFVLPSRLHSEATSAIQTLTTQLDEAKAAATTDTRRAALGLDVCRVRRNDKLHQLVVDVSIQNYGDRLTSAELVSAEAIIDGAHQPAEVHELQKRWSFAPTQKQSIAFFNPVPPEQWEKLWRGQLHYGVSVELIYAVNEKERARFRYVGLIETRVLAGGVATILEETTPVA